MPSTKEDFLSDVDLFNADIEDSNSDDIPELDKPLDEITLDDLETYKKAYYEGNPIITDEQYDSIIQNKFKGVDPLGYKDIDNTKFEVLEHSIRMKGQEKVLSYQEYLDWIKETNDFYGEELEYIVQYKLDGLSLSLNYVDGELETAILRGDGDKGENILNNAKRFKGVKSKIPYKENILIRGEIVITQADFDKVPLEKKSNRRNVAAGLARRQDNELANYLTFVCWDCKIPDESIELPFKPTEMSKLKWVRDELGFQVVPTIRAEKLTEELYNKYGDDRESKDLLIDGLVIKINQLEKYDELKEQTDTHQGQVALKFAAQRRESILKDVIWNVGKTGKITPTASIKPVRIGGVTIENVTLCSLQEIERLELQIGEKIIVERRGDVIPKIYAYDGEYATSDFQKDIEIPEYCPCCNKKLKRKGADLYCTNNTCKAQLAGKIDSVFKLLEIKGFGEEICKQLVDANKVKTVADIFYLDEDDLMDACNFKIDNASKLISRIKEVNSITLAQLIAILQIPNIGLTIGEKIENQYRTLKALLDSHPMEYEKYIGESSAYNLYNGLLNNEDVIERIVNKLTLEEKVLDDKDYIGAFCFTGFRDRDLSAKLQNMGYKELNGVTKECTHLIVKDMSKQSSKFKKAEKYGTKIMSLNQLKDILASGSNTI